MNDENDHDTTYTLHTRSRRKDSESSEEEASPQALVSASKSGKVVSSKVANSKTPKAGVSKVTEKQPTNSRPPYMTMVVEALTKLDKKSGSSRQAIQKYITETYGIEESKTKPHLHNALVNGVQNQVLVQVSGTGAIGSFKLVKKPQNSGSASGGETSKKKLPTGKLVKKTAIGKSAAGKPAAGKPAAKKPATKTKAAAAAKSTATKKQQ
ncbi:putative histone H1.6 [Oratosquilla oratoria]|uniref:putative histone H1.6 n=1 Tax=Oratosquilla oratoria TaxID=337810 RepID=UPI003F760B0C